MAEPVEYEVVHRRVFGLAPNGLLAALSVALGAIAVFLFFAGLLLAGVLFAAAAVLLSSLWLEQTGRRRGRVRDLSSLARGTLGAWSSAGRELARIRLEATRITKERSRVLYAVEQGDSGAAERLAALERELEECVERANAALSRSRRRTSEERLAAARTVIRPKV